MQNVLKHIKNTTNSSCSRQTQYATMYVGPPVNAACKAASKVLYQGAHNSYSG